jgi:hypothetical protein
VTIVTDAFGHKQQESRLSEDSRSQTSLFFPNLTQKVRICSNCSRLPLQSKRPSLFFGRTSQRKLVKFSVQFVPLQRIRIIPRSRFGFSLSVCLASNKLDAFLGSTYEKALSTGFRTFGSLAKKRACGIFTVLTSLSSLRGGVMGGSVHQE